MPGGDEDGMNFNCADKEMLIAYLYGEGDAATRSLVEAHLATCAGCADEVAGFGKVRTMLAEWTPPERAAGFKLVRDEPSAAGAHVLRPARWWRSPLPVWAQVAAAVVLFAGGAALANVEVHYGKDGFVVRTGWLRPPSPASQAPVEPRPVPAQLQASTATPWRADLASLERQLRDEIHQQALAARGGATAVPVQASAPAVDEQQIMARVQALLDASERRQQNEMAYRIGLVAGDLQNQRLADMRRVQQGFALTGAEVVKQRQAITNLFGVSLKK